VIKIPLCCYQRPFGFIEIKIDERITKIPLCEKHHDDFANNSGKVEVNLWVLEAGDKIPGVTRGSIGELM